MNTSNRSPVTVTYSKKGKRKTTRSEQNDEQSDASSSDTRSQLATANSKATMQAPLRQTAVKNTPKKAGPKSVKLGQTPGKTPGKAPPKIDLRDVPGPGPKRRNSADGSEKSLNVPKSTPSQNKPRSTHMRTKSTASLSSLSHVRARAGASSSPNLAKTTTGSGRGNEAPAGAKPVSKAVSAAPSVGLEDEEEDASVADSFADSVVSAAGGGKISRTVKDRQEYYKNQSDCHAFGPHRAVCSRCKQVVNLTRKQTYAVGPWERHRAKCDQELASDSPLPPNASELVNAPVDVIFGEQPVRRNAAERRAYLLADKHIVNVEEERVKCAKCEKWVALKKGQPYDLTKWKQHSEKCTPDSPSERVHSAERKLAIVNDPLVKSFDTATIECAQCGTRVAGSLGQDYDIGAWEEHKAQCRLPAQAEPSANVNAVPFPSSSSEKPPSVASTDVTLVAADTSRQNLSKRAREDGAEDEHPSNRPRTEGYEPPVKDAPGVMGWFMLPFQSFARGFKESLRNDKPPTF